jgi:hypothetical protein
VSFFAGLLQRVVNLRAQLAGALPELGLERGDLR